MNSAAAIIDAINARSAPPGRLREAARASWHGWLDRLSDRPGRVTGAPAQALVDQMAARPLAAPLPRASTLTRWQAFSTLWRQQWHPASSDERRWRWTAGGVSFGWHVVLVILLLWIAALRLLERPRPSEDEAVQVEFIGIGTPAEAGGGPAPTAAPDPRQESPREAARAASGAAAPAPAPAASSVSPPEPATEAAPASAAAQPLVVSPPVSPEPATFELPPTRMPDVAVAPRPTDAPTVEMIEIPTRPELSPRPVAQVDVDARVEPVRPATAATVDARDIPERPVIAPRPVAVPAPPVDAPAPARSTAQVTERAIPDRSPAAPAPAPSRPSAQPSAAPASTAARPASAPAGPRNAAPSTGIGVGPRPVPAPGAFPTPRRADDWGESMRDRVGADARGPAGNGDAWPRVGDPPGSASAGLPPGMATTEIRDLDRAGTWLRRTPNGYEPTRFDRFWRPNETLLQEWVRRGVRDVGIPVPGTSKRIVCKVSLLALGGACTITDPNLNEQPASARPPPDIPYKPHLQEGSGATVPPTTPPPGTPPGI